MDSNILYVYEHADWIKTYLSDGQYYIEIEADGEYMFDLDTTVEGVWGKAADWILRRAMDK
jgi:hypothetical protein